MRVGAPAVEPLAAALRHEQPGVRRGAADTLRELGPAAQPAWPALRDALTDHQRDVRLAAVRAAVACGAPVAEVSLALVERLQDEDARVRDETAAALVQLGPETVPNLTAALGHPRPPARQGAARALGQLGPAAKPAERALLPCLDDADPHVRREAALTLAQLTGRAEAVPVLFASLQQRNVRYDALQGLMKCGPPGINALTAALADKDEVVRGEAARALGEVGPAAGPAVAALVAALGDADRSVRREAAHALGRIGAAPETSVPALVVVLRDSWPVNRGEAAIALQRFGPQGKAAAPALVAALKDESLDASREAAKALVEIGPAAVPALRQALADADETLRSRAQEVLRQLESP